MYPSWGSALFVSAFKLHTKCSDLYSLQQGLVDRTTCVKTLSFAYKYKQHINGIYISFVCCVVVIGDLSVHTAMADGKIAIKTDGDNFFFFFFMNVRAFLNILNLILSTLNLKITFNYHKYFK